MSDQEIEQESLEHLENIAQGLKEIKNRTGGRWNSLRNGLWQGMGAIIGSIAAIMLVGFLLNLFGFFPGLKDVGEYVQKSVDSIPHR